MVSARETRVMPMAATNRGPTSATLVHGSEGLGRPRGSVPTVGTPWACRSRTAEKTVAATIATKTAGKPPREPRQHHQDGQDAQTDEQRRHDGPVESEEESLDFGTEALGVGRESEELRQLPDDDHEGETVHVPDLDLVRQEVGDESQLRDAESDLDQSDDQGQHAGQGDLSVHVPRNEEGQQSGKDHR